MRDSPGFSCGPDRNGPAYPIRDLLPLPLTLRQSVVIMAGQDQKVTPATLQRPGVRHHRLRRSAMQPEAYIRYTDTQGTEWRWWGGEYVECGYEAPEDMGPFNNKGQPSYEKGEWVALDVINVWDYETGEPSIEFTPDALAERVEQHNAGVEA